MNKRARTRLIGVTAIVLVAVAAIVFGMGGKQGAYYKSVDQVASDSSLVGKRVRVGGAVVPGSWDKGTNPMRFTIRAEEDSAGTGKTIKVVYSKSAPSTFGDGVVAIVTGTLQPDGVIESTDMITKCPSKYESAASAMSVAALVANKDAKMTFTKVTGYLVPNTLVPPSSGERFKLADSKDGSGATVSVVFEGTVPDGVESKKLVVTGKHDASGTFTATEVAVDAAQK